MRKVVLYTKSNCNFSIQAERACKQLAELDAEFKFIVLKLNTDFTMGEFNIIFPGADLIPQVVVDGINVGGWDDFKPQAMTKIIGN
jgi:glutaredoxin|tara:strand:- start:922 stop:1179 length:258 start_codon:yes stop_codon:yes gene_type:complete